MFSALPENRTNPTRVPLRGPSGMIFSMRAIIKSRIWFQFGPSGGGLLSAIWTELSTTNTKSNALAKMEKKLVSLKWSVIFRLQSSISTVGGLQLIQVTAHVSRNCVLQVWAKLKYKISNELVQVWRLDLCRLSSWWKLDPANNASLFLRPWTSST